MDPIMEKLLHYVWKHKLFPTAPLTGTDGERIEVIDPGLHNGHAGPDFFNAKIKVDGTLWVGNVELHERSSQWYRHGHDRDKAYDNVVLHVTAEADETVRTAAGRRLPQLVLHVPEHVEANYQELLTEEAYPPCWRVIPDMNLLTVHSWLSALTTERLEEKTRRITDWLHRTGGDWEQTLFVTLARNFGFGVNSETFENWAATIPTAAAGKHRDDLFQIEALFLGQAGLLDNTAVDPEHRDGYFGRLQKEYSFLAHKFGLSPIDAGQWKFLRMRPQNFPHVRLSQLALLYHTGRFGFSQLIEAREPEALRELLRTNATPYWETHYTFGTESRTKEKHLQTDSLNLLIINTVIPLLFAYGRHRFDERLSERAFELLEKLPAERNFITRSWQKAGLEVKTAADSQALVQLHRNYCDRKDCLRCRFGCEYLRSRK